jgi:hypothetical protein
MEERPKSGISTNNLLLSEPDITINLGILRALVRPTTCKSGPPIHNGSKFSSTRKINSLTGPTTRSLRLKELRMKKDKPLVYGVTMEDPIKNGPLFILTKLRALKLRDLTKISASMSTDHSTSFQSYHSTE